MSGAPNRRAALPGADELFRTTGPERNASAAAADSAMIDGRTRREQAADERRAGPLPRAGADRADQGTQGTRTRVPRRAREGTTPSGRERHEEKITVYVSGAELVELERARLVLRAEHGLAVDRGRIVREALAVVLADLDAKAHDSILVRRLRG